MHACMKESVESAPAPLPAVIPQSTKARRLLHLVRSMILKSRFVNKKTLYVVKIIFGTAALRGGQYSSSTEYSSTQPLFNKPGNLEPEAPEIY